MAHVTKVSSAVEGSSNPSRRMILDDDQMFLLSFIMGSFFGPDIKGERLPKSALRRKFEGLPPYTSDELSRSHMTQREIEWFYHLALGKAEQSHRVESDSFLQFLTGELPPLGYPQFPAYFPLEVHPHSQLRNECKIVANIVFINNPEIFHMNGEDIERFKRLTGLDSFLLDVDAASLPAFPDSDDSCNGRELGVELDEEVNALRSSIPPRYDSDSAQKGGPTKVFFPSQLTNQEMANILGVNKTGCALTGSAAMGQMGPVVGPLDIGESEDSYLFRVSLPGVKRDGNEFSCEVEADGKVLIRGVTTTGEKRVTRYAQVFEMQSQNLCPPGHFSLSFQLPGPVDPPQFSGNFGIDGILQGIVMKRKDKNS